MKNEPTAASGGTEIVPVQPDKRPVPDDIYRQYAVEKLALHLTRGSNLLARCEAMANASVDTGPLHAAARVMNANANLARALAQVAQVERRSRTIVETIQKPDPKIAGLNARFSALLKNEEFCAFLERGLRRLVEIPAQKREEPPAIEYSI